MIITVIYRVYVVISCNVHFVTLHEIQIFYCTADPPGCGCGFMSVERMRILRRLETVGSAINPDQRQQITPDIKFTCDGMITKWIIGANITLNSSFYPELQVWRNIGNDMYQKKNGTFITAPTENPNRIYEYDNFSPIPFQAGDILGVFLPQLTTASLGLLSETTDSPTNYYLMSAEDTDDSTYDIIDLQNTESLFSQDYHPLVSVEIGKLMCEHFEIHYFVVPSFKFLFTVMISHPSSEPTPLVYTCMA